MEQIRLLPKEVSELVAAGEVVERPASVVKELMENCVDAGAKAITVEIKNGGISYLRVTDNGCGIAPDQVATAFLRHATSKIAVADDLDRIGTLGFRGEALASVCAVSKVELMTKKAELEMGCRCVVAGGEVLEQYETGCPDGTTILVRDLFYNVPARLKFLRKDVSEGNAVAQIVERLALSHPEISVRFLRDSREILYTPGNGRSFSAIYAVLGKEFASDLLEVKYQMGFVGITGYVCKPYAAQGSRAMQICFINGRYVRSRTVFAALEQAYKNNIATGKFPACVLFLNLPLNTVDVNIHPSKTEVRFDDERPVFDAVYYAVKSVLEGGKTAPKVALGETGRLSEQPRASISIAFDEPQPPKVSVSEEPPAPPVSVPVSRAEAMKAVFSARPEEELSPPEKEAPPDESEALAVPEQPVEAPPAPKLPEKNSLPAEEKALPPEEKLPLPEELQLLGEVFSTYAVLSAKGELLLMDKHAAHERILFEQLKAELGRISGQLLLEPVAVRLSGDELSAVLANAQMLAGLGFELEEFGDSVLLRQVPVFIAVADAEGLLREIAGDLTAGKSKPQLDRIDDILHTTACKAAIKAGRDNSPAELLSIARQVLTDPKIRYCPHGRPVLISLSKYELDKRFGRV